MGTVFTNSLLGNDRNVRALPIYKKAAPLHGAVKNFKKPLPFQLVAGPDVSNDLLYSGGRGVSRAPCPDRLECATDMFVRRKRAVGKDDLAIGGDDIGRAAGVMDHRHA